MHLVDRRAHLALHALDPPVHAIELVLQVHHAFDPCEVEAGFGRELLDQAQPVDVGVGVQARVAGRALRAHEALLLVHAKRLLVHADELRGDADHVARPVVHQLVLPSSSSSSRCFLLTFFGTVMRTRASTSPLPGPFSFGAPRPLMRSSLPSSVPAGIFSATGPSGVGTSTVPPRATTE